MFFDGLSNSDALLYGYLNGFAKALGKDPDERIVWESTRSIATKLNMSPTTVSECIKHLESAGLLKVQRAKGKPTVMHHFVKQRRTDIFDRSCERTGSDVDFIAAAGDGYPSVVSHGEVPIRSWGGLNSDGGS